MYFLRLAYLKELDEATESVNLLLDSLPSDSYTASSSLNDTTQPHHSRILDPDAAGWFSRVMSVGVRDEWIQVDFLQPKFIREFQLAAIGNLYAYISSFEMHASLDEEVYTEISESESKILGSVDNRQVFFDKLMFCRFFKLVALSAVGHIAVRWEFVEADSKFTH